MSIVTIALFFIYTYCLGFTISSFVKNSENFFERNLMRIGFGFSVLPFLALVLNIIKIPADWRIILGLSLVYPLYYLSRNYGKLRIPFSLTKTNVSIFIMLFIFSINFYVYITGAFSYPYLEDDDSWGHSQTAKYYSIEKNAFSDTARSIRYMTPYPPAYAIVMGILHQTNDSIYWTLKFFNALIVSLSIIFFYFFVKELSGSKNKALFASFALFSIPAFMSHFIWSLSIAVPLYFIVFYAFERIKHDKKWWIITGLVMVAALTASPTHSTFFGLLFLFYVATKMILEKKILFNHILAGVFGLILSFVFWWLPMIIKYGFFGTLQGLGIAVGQGTGALSVGGTGDRVYAFSDFFFAQDQNMINNPIGIGVVLSLLVAVALIYVLLKYKSSLYRNKIIISSIFLVLTTSMLFLLFTTYTKAIWVDGNKQDISFGVFVSDQFFLILSLTLSLLVFLNLVVANYKDPNFNSNYLVIVMVWFIFLFYAVNAAPFQFKLSPFRAWMLFAIPVCILAAEGAFYILDIAKRSAGNIGKIAVLALLLTGVYFTSTQQKIAVNTASWPPGGFWTSVDEIGAYIWLKDNIPPETKVFSFVIDGPTIGMDKFICFWCEDIKEFKRTGSEKTAQEISSFLKSKGYEYLIIDGQYAQKYGPNETNSKLQELAESGLFRPVFQNQGAVIFGI
jgi:hypothetical protein